MDKTWAEVACEVPAAMVDLLADFLVELSGNGVSIDNLELDTFSLDTMDEAPVKTVRAYFTPDDELEGKLDALIRFIQEHAPAYGDAAPAPPTVTTIREEDWATGWRQHFAPTRIGRKLVIKPTWEPFSPEPGDLVIELDPGMAFGTGTHPTTRLCLEALEKLGTAGDVLDVGTGSGILAMAAVKLGAQRVVGTDIDPDAVAVARENCAMNGVTAELVTTPLADIPGQFAVVLANILAEDLVRMAADLTAKVAPGGFLILSGILVERESYVIDGFASTGLTLAETTREGEWSCLLYRAGQ
ncbi:50S ribosomal protein L11 methyltransferase [Geobacter hydrogenophilus]|uniref:Ribosomal protein L11 methyltransferase n=1 Tax=Geobacter hydrogenophilus TaxID=40983 RepID=A0A9W6FZR2_9BACT|nr:50S ribosomal protein L11 methyltransferase [Geobacter hydrogenophilus]MBT0893425.1 50S ribosomal protein L11 methyltransferase [Geobacter hydrogenophilus]GLI37881.1 ribosomal protein L11 methyltransferase [Geobacter hydrogenophilus]